MLAGSGVLSACAAGRPPVQIRRIGYLTLTGYGLEQARLDPYAQQELDAFRNGLREAGHVEGKSVSIEVRWAELGEEDRLAALAVELAGLPVDLIVAASGAAAMAARRAAPSVPLVFVAVGDPTGIGLSASLNRPGGNATGLSSLSPALSGKRLELLRTAFPGVSRVSVFQHQADPDAAAAIRQMATAAPLLGMQLQHLRISGIKIGSSDSDIFGALQAAATWRPDALMTLGSYNHWTALVTMASRSRLPTLADRREFIHHAGVMAYGPDLEAMFRRAAVYADRIMMGAKPADLPVEQPTGFKLSINLLNAANAGLSVSPEILPQADEVIR